MIENQEQLTCKLASLGRSTAVLNLKFDAGDEFHHELRRRVSQYFKRTGLRQRGCAAMYRKTAIILLWFIASYVLLVFFAAAWWQAVPLTLSLGFAMAAVGFNIAHDGGHRAYSERPWINKLMALSLDLLGGSSFVWARKHNSIHHSYTNITEHDDDINLGFLGRLSPHQKRLKVHRLQHFYLWALYGLLPIKWQFLDNFQSVLTGRIGPHPLSRPRSWDLVLFVAGKLLFFSLALVIPIILHPTWLALLTYVAASFVEGVTLSVVFQLAHCVEEATFPLPQPAAGRMANAWAVHQVETTVDFARGSKLLSWLLGGLNFQIEHHLFPQVCHTHYAALAPLVEQTCKDFGVRYVANPSLIAGLASHYRWLRRMGAPVTLEAFRL
jgi:linoleoyl-CoA desaturase